MCYKLSIFVLVCLTTSLINVVDGNSSKNSSHGNSSKALIRNMHNMWEWISNTVEVSESAVAEGRTFGRMRKMQMLLIPLVFKFGVMTTLIAVLVFLALKSVFLLKTLLLVNLGVVLAKIIAYKYEHKTDYHSPLIVGGDHSPHTLGWSEPQPSKEVHVHIHNQDGKHELGHGESPHIIEPYGAYSSNGINYVNPNYGHTIPHQIGGGGPIHKTYTLA